MPQPKEGRIMQLDPEHLSVAQVYSVMIRAITPRPIAWVSTRSSSGIFNLAPFSYFNGVGSAPPSLVFSPVNKPDGSKKDTVRNIEDTGEFVVNMVPFSLVQPMHQSSANYEFDVSEFESVGVTPADSVCVTPPRVQESPLQFECKLIQIVPVGDGPFAANLVIGKIVWMHIADEVLNEKGKIDPSKMDSIGRMGGLEYARTNDRFAMPPATVSPKPSP